ncbi:MAG: hypothetical protein HKM89_13645 [Gemmatimonadales bacterium]|nr:hypothetical protein [Gemmatimonadales bacterium]
MQPIPRGPLNGRRPTVAIEQVISGGQTGVDRAALEVAEELGLGSGGWCPAGRLAEDGTIPEHYPLRETPTSEYEERTEWNVRDSDGTLILTIGQPSGGTAHTIECAQAAAKPYFVLDLDAEAGAHVVREWLERNRIRTLNVAGPRESKAPGIEQRAARYLLELLAADLPREARE